MKFFIETHNGRILYPSVFSENEATEFVRFFNNETNYGKYHPIKAIGTSEDGEIITMR